MGLFNSSSAKVSQTNQQVAVQGSGTGQSGVVRGGSATSAQGGISFGTITGAKVTNTVTLTVKQQAAQKKVANLLARGTPAALRQAATVAANNHLPAPGSQSGASGNSVQSAVDASTNVQVTTTDYGAIHDALATANSLGHDSIELAYAVAHESLNASQNDVAANAALASGVVQSGNNFAALSADPSVASQIAGAAFADNSSHSHRLVLIAGAAILAIVIIKHL